MKRPGRIARAIRPGRSFSRKFYEALRANGFVRSLLLRRRLRLVGRRRRARGRRSTRSRGSGTGLIAGARSLRGSLARGLRGLGRLVRGRRSGRSSGRSRRSG